MLYLLSSTHTHLKDVKGAYDICQQQKDSLLAQLQVVYEQKNRVEKFLQQEKLDHRKTKEENSQNKESRNQLEKEKNDLEGKLNSLQQDQQTLQTELSQLKEKISQTEDELNKQQSDRESSIQIKDSEITQLKGEVSSLVVERDQLQQNLDAKQKEFEKVMNELHTAKEANKNLQEVHQPPQIHGNDVASMNDQHAAKPKSSTDNDKPNQAIPAKSSGGGVTNHELSYKDAKLNKSEVASTLKIPADNKKGVQANTGQVMLPKPIAETNDVHQPAGIQKPVLGPINISNNGEKADDIRKMEEQEEPQHVAPQPHNENPAVLAPLQDNLKETAGVAWESGLKRGPQLKEPPAKNSKNVGPALQNNHQAEDNEDYRDEGGDDAAAEEQDTGDDGVFMAAEKSPRDKQFGENDFEDNPDGGDRNHARGEGVVVAPK